MKFNMSDAWRDATAMMSGNREVLLIVAGLFFFLPSLVLGLVLGDIQNEVQSLALGNPESAGEIVFSIYGRWWWLLLAIAIVSVVGYLALLALLRDNSRPTVGEAIRIGFTGLLPAIGTYIVLCLGMAIGATVLAMLAGLTGSNAVIVPMGAIIAVLAVYVVIKVSLSGPVIAIDKVYNPFKVLARSWRLTKGNSLRLFLFYLLLIIVYIVIALVVGMIVGVLTFAVGQSAGTIVNAVLSGVVSAAVYVVFVAVVAAAHRQLAGPSAAAVSETFE